eukprot:TRINITY_DN7605_c0_g1_i4.p2 TRINITY_DN7605_c0_g1~~TRINITY_DN7605_c0_g1_i4.p2  ORF type:complete len:101 (-),score=38.47 TRINITY_DN7605_c0_g1_i4:70-372(-)
MQSKYLNISLSLLEENLKDDINSFYNSEATQNVIIFVIYVLYLVVVYIFWNTFILEAQEELWKTKSILCIMSPTLIMSIVEVKSFILNNSSAVFLSSKKS